MDKKQKYTVKPGRKFGKNKEFKPGDVVELTPEEAAGFLDKLTPVADPVAVEDPGDQGDPDGKKGKK